MAPAGQSSSTSATTSSTSATTWSAEVDAGERFEFGANWASFLAVLTADRIEVAEASVKSLLGSADACRGKTLLDVGSGSGLFSLAARNLGATVTSFDFDAESVACTRELQRRYHDGDGGWTVTSGSVLDDDFMASLGTFDIVYSWGVLHHTGSMWRAIAAAGERVRPGGCLAIALYNDQGIRSRMWTAVKRLHAKDRVGRALMRGVFVPYFATTAAMRSAARRENIFAAYRKSRGMSIVHDWLDWIGGYPFEVAGPGDVFQFVTDRGFVLETMNTTTSLGCNEFVFRKVEGDDAPPSLDGATL